MSEISQHVMTEQDARRLTERIRLSLDTASKSLDRLASLVAEAYRDRADLALGYTSWSEYSESEFSEQTRDLAAPIRRELVGRLSEAGMSTNAIAPTMGISHQAVSKSRAKFESEQVATAVATSPESTSEAVNTETGEIFEPAPAAHGWCLDIAAGTTIAPESSEHLV